MVYWQKCGPVHLAVPLISYVTLGKFVTPGGGQVVAKLSRLVFLKLESASVSLGELVGTQIVWGWGL